MLGEVKWQWWFQVGPWTTGKVGDETITGVMAVRLLWEGQRSAYSGRLDIRPQFKGLTTIERSEVRPK